jgi:ankyrin repeat protein
MTIERNPDDSWTSNALQRHDIEAVKRRVEEDPAYLTSRDYVASTPLLNAVVFNEVDLVRFMIQHGADPDPIVDDGYTSLLTAVESDDPASIQILSLLIEAGADIHRTGTNGWTPLHMAAARGHVEKARLLIAAGASVNHRKEIDASETPLIEAASQGRGGMVRLLLEQGADPTLRDTINERTPLEIAEHSRKGADPAVLEHIKSMDYTPIHADILANLDIPPETLEKIRPMFANLDMAEQYRQAADKRAEEGDFEEVIRLLLEAAGR